MRNKQKQISIAEVEQSVAINQSIAEMQGRLRQAIFDSISEADVSAIVAKKVEKAKAGDNASLQFVMKYVLGLGISQSLQQINVMRTDVETAARIAKGGFEARY